MRDALQSYLTLAGGLTEVTRQRAVAAAKALVAQGEATAEQVQGLAEDLLSQTRHNSETVTALVRYEVERALGRLGLASGDDVTHLLGRVAALEEQVRALHQATTRAPAKTAPAKSPATKAPPAKKGSAGKTPAKAASTPAKAGEAPAQAPVPPDSGASRTGS